MGGELKGTLGVETLEMVKFVLENIEVVKIVFPQFSTTS
jgi:hypothetical protein